MWIQYVFRVWLERKAWTLKHDFFSKTRKRLNWMKRDKTCTFSRKSSVSSYEQPKNRKKKQQQLNQLILCQLDVGGWRKEKGTRLSQSFSCSFPSARASLMLFSFHQPPTFNWHKIGWINCFFFCFYVVCGFKKRTSPIIYTFCPVSSS